MVDLKVNLLYLVKIYLQLSLIYLVMVYLKVNLLYLVMVNLKVNRLYLVNPLTAATRGTRYKFFSKWHRYLGNRVVYNLLLGTGTRGPI